MNENGWKLIDLCLGRKMSVGNSLFKKKGMQKFIG